MPKQDEGLDPKYRMPRCFGYAPGPRNLPVHQRHRRYEKEIAACTMSARTDPDQLAQFLPEGLVLGEEARLEVCVMSFHNIGWLAGRGYDILMVRIPARWMQRQKQQSGYFVPVVWENMADPIITGREELGWSKIFADISVSAERDEQWRCTASWDGHRFFDFQAAAFEEAASAPSPMPMVFEKYVPTTGDPQASDAHYLTITASDGPDTEIRSVERGEGKFEFRGASWEQMPTQYPIVNALASLPLEDFGPVTRVMSSGGGDGSGQARLVPALSDQTHLIEK
ncbi:acetoacetate decarboxylase family protein [Alteraurantiacibacter aestuarii]|uniref:Acetoacetate decarboxylase n=1 Tax=Alteraurantiacibacter aestuarii TaxID=650004 RepID=A0A844ZK40_9SPHN|nr:acetoacetate decarboxylase family protein [Alteraurantiacibacter aestuarii]MXO88165.1 hypothetical protein [Alteraurantiacibacter aestuarii]